VAATAQEVREEAAEAQLLRGLGAAQQMLDRPRQAWALADLGEIDLPAGAPTTADAAALEPLGPFYLAAQLEAAGVLRTAESVAGLYASGAITAELGEVGERIRRFWQERRGRLTEPERRQLLEGVFEAPHFDRMQAAVARALADHADNGAAVDWRESARLEQAGQQLALFLVERSGGMVGYAARETVAALGEAVAFLREPKLQAAFSVRSLWALVRVAAPPEATGADDAATCVDRGRSGQALLAWLCGAARSGRWTVDPRTPEAQALIAAAERWLLAQEPTVPVPALKAAA